MFKTILRTLPSLTGNFKLACYINKSNVYQTKDVYGVSTDYVYVTHGDFSPLNAIYDESFKFKKRIPLSFSSTMGYEFDIKNYYKNYADSFYSLSNFIGYQDKKFVKYENDFEHKSYQNQKTSRDMSFEYGMTNLRNSNSVRIDNVYYNKSYYAPIYVDAVEDMAHYFCITIAKDNKPIKRIMIDLYNDINTSNYLGYYLHKYIKSINPLVVYTNAYNKYAMYNGIDVEHGGFVSKQDNDISYIFNNLITQNMYDYYICRGFERNKLIMKQIIPLAYEFNIESFLPKRFVKKNMLSSLTVSGHYMRDEYHYVTDIYDFSHDYKEFRPYHKEYITNSKTIGYFAKKFDENVLDSIEMEKEGFLSLNESKYIKYKYTNEFGKVNYTRFKLMNSSDKTPYISNLSWGYTALSHKYTAKYGETPTYMNTKLPVISYSRGLSDIRSLLYNNLTTSLTYNNDDNRALYDSIQANFVSEWFDNDVTTTYIDIDKHIFKSNMKVLYKGFMYDLSKLANNNSILNIINKCNHIKFGITLSPEIIKVDSYETLSQDMVEENGYVLYNANVNDIDLYYKTYNIWPYLTAYNDKAQHHYENTILDYEAIINNLSGHLLNEFSDNDIKTNIYYTERNTIDGLNSFSTKLCYDDSKKFIKYKYEDIYDSLANVQSRIESCKSLDELYNTLGFNNLSNVFCEISGLTDMRDHSLRYVNKSIVGMKSVPNRYINLDEIQPIVESFITNADEKKTVYNIFVENSNVHIKDNVKTYYIAADRYYKIIDDIDNPNLRNTLNNKIYELYVYDITTNTYEHYEYDNINKQNDTRFVYFDLHNVYTLLKDAKNPSLIDNLTKERKIVPFINKNHLLEWYNIIHKNEYYNDTFNMDQLYALYPSEDNTLKYVKLTDIGIFNINDIRNYVTDASESGLFNINSVLAKIANNELSKNDIQYTSDVNKSDVPEIEEKEKTDGVVGYYDATTNTMQTISNTINNANDANDAVDDSTKPNGIKNTAVSTNHRAAINSSAAIANSANMTATINMYEYLSDAEKQNLYDITDNSIDDKDRVIQSTIIKEAISNTNYRNIRRIKMNNCMIVMERDLYLLTKEIYDLLIKDRKPGDTRTLYLYALQNEDISFIEKYNNNQYSTVSDYTYIVKKNIKTFEGYDIYDLCFGLFNSPYVKNMYNEYDNNLALLLNSNIISYNSAKNLYTLVENKKRLFVPLQDILINLERYIVNVFKTLSPDSLNYRLLKYVKEFMARIIDNIYLSYSNVDIKISRSNNDDTGLSVYYDENEDNTLYLRYDLSLILDNTSYTFNTDTKLPHIFNEISSIVNETPNAIKTLIPFIKSDIVTKYTTLMKDLTLMFPNEVILNIDKVSTIEDKLKRNPYYDIKKRDDHKRKIKFVRYFDYLTPYLYNINERYNDDELKNQSYVNYADPTLADENNSRTFKDNSNIIRRDSKLFKYENDIYLINKIYNIAKDIAYTEKTISEGSTIKYYSDTLNESILSDMSQYTTATLSNKYIENATMHNNQVKGDILKPYATRTPKKSNVEIAGARINNDDIMSTAQIIQDNYIDNVEISNETTKAPKTVKVNEYISSRVSSTQRVRLSNKINTALWLNSLMSTAKAYEKIKAYDYLYDVISMYTYNHKWYFDNESILMPTQLVFDDVDRYDAAIDEEIDLSIYINLRAKAYELFNKYINDHAELLLNINSLYGDELNSKILFLLSCYDINYEVVYDKLLNKEITNIILTLK